MPAGGSAQLVLQGEAPEAGAVGGGAAALRAQEAVLRLVARHVTSVGTADAQQELLLRVQLVMY